MINTSNVAWACCGCGEIWPDGDTAYCGCPTDCLWQKGVKQSSKLKSEWLKQSSAPQIRMVPFDWRFSLAKALRRAANRLTHPAAPQKETGT